MTALLGVDNAERLHDDVAAFADSLRSGLGGLRVLITSQEVLRADDEQLYRPGPLSLPSGGDPVAVRASGAVALFVAPGWPTLGRLAAAPATDST